MLDTRIEDGSIQIEETCEIVLMSESPCRMTTPPFDGRAQSQLVLRNILPTFAASCPVRLRHLYLPHHDYRQLSGKSRPSRVAYREYRWDRTWRVPGTAALTAPVGSRLAFFSSEVSPFGSSTQSSPSRLPSRNACDSKRLFTRLQPCQTNR